MHINKVHHVKTISRVAQSRLSESGQFDKWLFCLTAAMIAAYQEHR